MDVEAAWLRFHLSSVMLRTNTAEKAHFDNHIMKQA